MEWPPGQGPFVEKNLSLASVVGVAKFAMIFMMNFGHTVMLM
jgi:hypothetical protein